jgi:hypothetical protein
MARALRGLLVWTLITTAVLVAGMVLICSLAP